MSHESLVDPETLAVPAVRSLKPYLPGKPISELEREYGVSDIIKLASNENPLGASPRAVAAMQQAMHEMALYPDGGGFELKRRLAARHDVEPSRITLGNGSNDVLVLLAEAFLQPGLEAIYSQFCFAVYPIATQATGARGVEVPALEGSNGPMMGHDPEGMLASIGPQTRLVFIANPNNPTGTWLGEEVLRRFLDRVPQSVLVVVDEAYHEYSLQHGVPDASRWIDDYPNLVVARTFSKAYGLAAIRVGYCLSSIGVAGVLNRIRQPFNVNSLALAGACAALEDTAFIHRSVAANAQGIEQLARGLDRLGLAYLPSAANFLLVDFQQPALPVYESLLRAGIITRPVANYGLPRHLRITVGTASQNEQLLAALREVLHR